MGAAGGADASVTGKNRRPPLFRPGHQRPPEQVLAEARKRAEQRAGPRPTPAARGYDRQWRNVRAEVLAVEPNCRECARLGRSTPATMVDHIITLRERPDLRLERTNLQPLCKPCHNTKTIREDGGWGRPKRRKG
jgi:5-methylcytosine-specific restriction protein A